MPNQKRQIILVIYQISAKVAKVVNWIFGVAKCHKLSFSFWEYLMGV
jgi:hypothetical protein